jgi:hypothetical protein
LLQTTDTKGLPFEVLFDARNALFGPIPVTQQTGPSTYELLAALAEDPRLGDPDPHFAAERRITVSAIAVTPVPAQAAG